MHYNWIVYPEGMKKLEESALKVRIDIALKKHADRFSTLSSHLMNDETPLYLLDDLKEEGYFETMPFNFVKDFGNDVYQDWHQSLVKLVEKHCNLPWEIFRYEGKQSEPVCLDEDFNMLTGHNVAITLKPNQFWNFKKFGFSSLGDFFGTIGAYTRMKDKEYMERGHKWVSKQGNKLFQTEVTGSEHGDFRMCKRDVTPYKTIDPLGNLVSYRPETDEDARFIAGSHSVEPSFLAVLLKWAEQEKIESEILKNPADFIKQFKKMGQYCGNFADFGYDFMGPRMLFGGWEMSIQRFSEKFEHGHNPFNMLCYGSESGAYNFYIGDKEELIFSYAKNLGDKRKVSLEIPTYDFDNLVTGLFHQAQKGLGRTSIKQLADTIYFYFSEQFKADRIEEQEHLNRMKKK